MDLSHLKLSTAVATHLPLVRALIDELGIPEAIDELLPKHDDARVSDAHCVIALILNILSGKLALWKMQSWLTEIDLELVLGADAQADAFHDTRLGVALDHIDAVGTDVILARVIFALLRRDTHPTSYCVHLDTTSVSLYGRYLTVTEPLPVPARGHSKDRRPDLLQLIFGLSLVSGSGMPLTMSVASGNTSDPISNRDHLARIAQRLPPQHEVTIVADCKLVDAPTLGQLLDAGLHFVSLVPETFNVRKELVALAATQQPDITQWPVLARKKGRKKADPDTHYRGMSYEREMTVLRNDDGQTTKTKRALRLLVVHSEALQNKFDASLDAKIRKEVQSFQQGRARAHDKPFSCESDARKAAEKLVSKLVYHKAELELRQEDKVLKRARPGRPLKGEAAPTETHWVFGARLTRDDEAISQQRHASSCFVLVSDWTSAQWSDERVLAEYRSQSVVEGVTGFRWLKDVAEVAPVFLENPGRIRAFGLVLVLSLMVRNFLQYRLRGRMKERGQGIKHRFSGKIDDHLTAEMALAWFSGVQSIFVTLPGGQKTRAPPQILPQALEVLELLGLSVDIYTTPHA